MQKKIFTLFTLCEQWGAFTNDKWTLYTTTETRVLNQGFMQKKGSAAPDGSDAANSQLFTKCIILKQNHIPPKATLGKIPESARGL